MKKLHRSIKNQKGFTLVELLVCLFLSVLIIALLCQTILVNNKLYKIDIVRTNLNQDLKNALTILSANIKEAGENLPGSFPAIELRQNEETGFSDLIIRRNVLDEILKLCEPIDSSSSISELMFATAGTTSGCVYSDNTYNFNAWKSYREKNKDTIYPFVYDLENNDGEFFPYIDENDTGTTYSLVTGGVTFSKDYSVGSAAMYMIEQWRFTVEDGFLVLIENGNDDNPKKIINNVDKFVVKIKTKDGDLLDTFLPENDDMWSNISSINITIGNKETFMKEDIEKSLTGEYYPRNILSH